MDEPTRIAINGATGRMGETVQESAVDRRDVAVVVGVASERGESGDVPVVSSDARHDALVSNDIDVVIDFSTPDAVPALAHDCARSGVALVTGTTGLTEDSTSALRTASQDVAVLHATNFSRGIHALHRALDAALEAVPGYDIEVLETHHSGKQDAPSGTATSLLETIADHREFETVHGREGIQPREEGEVGVFSRRAGNVRGEHEVVFADNDEVLTLSHRAEDRGVFAAGALDSAVWLADRTAGWYTMEDVFTGTETETTQR